MIRIPLLVSVLLLSGLPFTVSAVDSDVVYSAPYIWVDPETGEVEMRNPGPQPKAHPDMSTEMPEAPASMVMAAEESESGPGDHASGAEAAAHINLLHPMIVLAGMIATITVIVVMGRKS